MEDGADWPTAKTSPLGLTRTTRGFSLVPQVIRLQFLGYEMQSLHPFSAEKTEKVEIVSPSLSSGRYIFTVLAEMAKPTPSTATPTILAVTTPITCP